jgi:hypothetical protein
VSAPAVLSGLEGPRLRWTCGNGVCLGHAADRGQVRGGLSVQIVPLKTAAFEYWSYGEEGCVAGAAGSGGPGDCGRIAGKDCSDCIGVMKVEFASALTILYG